MAVCGICPQILRPRAESTSQYFTICSVSARESPVEWKARRSILQHVFWRGNLQSSGKHVAVFYNMYFGEGISSRVESTSQYFTCILARESRVQWKARRCILHVFWRGNRVSGKHYAVFYNMYFGEGIASRVESTSQYFTTCILARESPVEWKTRGADRLQTNQHRLANKSTER